MKIPQTEENNSPEKPIGKGLTGGGVTNGAVLGGGGLTRPLGGALCG